MTSLGLLGLGTPPGGVFVQGLLCVCERVVC